MGTIFKWVLYSNFWIAFAALCLCWQTSFLVQGKIPFGSIHLLIFSSTLFVYTVHRLVSLKKLKQGQWQERFFHISQKERFLYGQAAIAFLATCILFFLQKRSVQISLLAPGLIALAYVLPILKGGKRIRDIHYIKIFLIALVWAWVSVYVIAIDQYMFRQIPVLLIFFERFFFIFAITLPFDIRDLLLDEGQQVKTLPGLIGLKRTRLAALVLLLFMGIFVYGNFYINCYSGPQVIAISISIIISYFLIHYSNSQREDYYFTGFLDGTMQLQFLLLYLSAFI